MSRENLNAAKRRVCALIDGFNLYHALDTFSHGIGEADRSRYQKYKWICLRSLVEQFVRPDEEELISVHYFSAYPTWDEPKRLRHQTYIKVISARGVEYTLGEFKPKWVDCRATCKQTFDMKEEKQTDVNIAVKMIEIASEYDTLILVTADSDQVPAVRLIRKLHPEKQIFILPPIGRNSKELVKAAGGKRLVMTEDHLRNALLPNPVDVVKDGKTIQIWKPSTWTLPE